MAIWRRFIHGLRGLLRRGPVERDLERELASYLDIAADDGVRSGLTTTEARRAAQVAMGSTAAIKDQVRDAGWEAPLFDVGRDIRYGVRLLRRSPGFTTAAVLTLAIGIGANTAIFSIVDAVLIRALPYPAPEQLVTLAESKPNFPFGSISFPNFKDWRDENTTFSSMAISRSHAFNLTSAAPERVTGEYMSSDFFSILGITPLVGRSFAAGEDEIGRPPIVLISEGLWRRQFAGAPDVIGHPLTLDGVAFTIVGVMPASVDVRVASFAPADVYLPVGQWANPALGSRSAGLGFHGIGRLKPGVTIAQARADLNRVTHHLAEAFPQDDTGIGATVDSFRDDVTGDAGRYLWPLLGAVGFVLLIACVNIGNLLLARSAGRQREFAARASLGATRERLVRQQVTESVLLALAGGSLGLTGAHWMTQATLALLPASLSGTTRIGIDLPVLVFTLAISIAVGVAFGLAPVRRVRLDRAYDTLKAAGRGPGLARSRTQDVLIAGEVALAVVLLTGAGLMVRTLGALWRVDPGFETAGLLTFGVSLSPTMRDATAGAVRTEFRRIDNAIARVPGVEATSLSWGASPLNGDDEDLFWFDGEAKPASTNDMKWALSYVVEPEYLQVMGIPLHRGRFFTRQDDEHGEHVVVIDDVFAHQYFHDGDPIGRRLVIPNKGGVATVIGVVGHVNQWGLDTDATESLRAQLYVPFMQLPDDAMRQGWSGIGALVRLNRSALASAASIRDAVRQVSAEDNVFRAMPMTDVIADTLATRRFVRTLLSIFSALAITLAGIGIYGVVGSAVSERTPELGLRMALGAQRWQVFASVMVDGLRMTGVGLAAGLLAASALTRLMRTLLFGVTPTDPLTFGAAAGLLALVAAVACLAPARRATRVDPCTALRA